MLKKLGVLILSLISILLIFLLALSFIFNSFLYPQIYFQAFEKAGVYNYVNSNLQNNAGATFIKIPQEGAKPLVENLFSNFLAYMRSDTNTLDLHVTIDQEKLRDFFLSSINEVQECKQGQDPFGQNPCLPRGQTAEQFLDDFLKQRNLSFFESDQVDLTKVYKIEEGSEGRKSLDNIRSYIKDYKTYSTITIFLIAMFFLLIFLLQKPEIKKTLRTFAYILIIPTALLASITYLLRNINEINLPDQLLISLATVVKDLIINKFMIYSLLIGIPSIALFLLSFIIKNKNINKNDNKSNKVTKK